jgi:glycosyltransferase involved in cell wall biosynthesis
VPFHADDRGANVTAEPRVSVVVPVRDRRDLLGPMLEALDSQTFRDFEVIIVDDGSTDGSAECADAAIVADSPARVLRQSQVGAVRAREIGVLEARGDILAFTDSDCMPSPTWLATGVEAMDQGADMVHGRTMPARRPQPRERTVTAGDDGLFATCNVFYRRDVFDAAGGFAHADAELLAYRVSARARGLGFGEDTLLGWRVKRSGADVRYVPEAVVHHHVFPPALTDRVHRALMAAAFPGLVREVPELRAHLVRWGVLFGSRRRIPMYAAAAAFLLRRRRLLFLAAGLWAFARLREVYSHGVPVSELVRAVPEEMLLDVVTGSALIAGGIRSRRVLL